MIGIQHEDPFVVLEHDDAQGLLVFQVLSMAGS